MTVFYLSYKILLMEKLTDALLNFRPTVQQREQIEQICQQTGVPRSIILRRALADYLARYGPHPSGLGLIKKNKIPHTE